MADYLVSSYLFIVYTTNLIEIILLSNQEVSEFIYYELVGVISRGN